MLSYHTIILLLFFIKLSKSIRTCFTLYKNSLYIYIAIINEISYIIIQIQMQYKYPIIFVSWFLLTTPMIQNLIIYTYKKEYII